MDKSKIHIGTSGWNYPEWKKVFYPSGMRQADYLRFYGSSLKAVEINSTFYSLPDKTSVKSWSEAVGGDFTFTVKASRYITHMKKLKYDARSMKRFFGAIGAIRRRTDVILFQLPPRFGVNTERLRSFLAVLPDIYRYAFEFRDRSWFCDEVFDALREKKCALCAYDMNGRTEGLGVTTADYVYARLHGPRNAYKGNYSKKLLRIWAGRIRKWRMARKEVYIFFDNDQKGYAAQNALSLDGMLE